MIMDTNLHTPVLVAHVLIAVLGLGSIASVAIVSATARRVGRSSTGVLPWIGSLLRYATFSLAAVLTTGVLLDLTAGGAFRATWWLRGSALLLVASGLLLARARRAVRRGLAKEDDSDLVLRRVERIGYGMCALIAIIVVLMLLKPF
jgi:hypothetical protein